MEYKIGDKVRVVESDDKSMLGKEGTIVNVLDKSAAVLLCQYGYTSNVYDDCIWLEYSQIEHVNDDMPANTSNYSAYEMRFFALTEEMRKTFIDKNRDYGSSFSDTVRKFGTNVAIARIHDKYMRLENMALGKEMNVRESMRDALMDMANYCLLTVLELDVK